MRHFLLLVLMERRPSITLLRTNANSLLILDVPIFFDGWVAFMEPAILGLVVAHFDNFMLRLHLLTLLILRLLHRLMLISLLILVRVAAAGRGLLALLAVVAGVQVRIGGHVVVHADARAAGAQREVVVFLAGTRPIPRMPNSIATSRLVLARFFLF